MSAMLWILGFLLNGLEKVDQWPCLKRVQISNCWIFYIGISEKHCLCQEDLCFETSTRENCHSHYNIHSGHAVLYLDWNWILLGCLWGWKWYSQQDLLKPNSFFTFPQYNHCVLFYILSQYHHTDLGRHNVTITVTILNAQTKTWSVIEQHIATYPVILCPTLNLKSYSMEQSLEKLLVTQLVKKLPIQPESLLPCSLSWARCIQFTTSHSYFPKIHSNIAFPLMHRSSEWSLPFGFPNHIVCISLMHTTCPAHFILIDFIKLIIFSEVYKL